MKYVCLAFLLTLAVAADDKLDAEFGKPDPTPRFVNSVAIQYRPNPVTIQPQKGIYGLAWGSTPKALTAKFGPPSAKLNLKYKLTGLVYGRSHHFIFEEKKLVAVELRSFVNSMVPPHRFFGGLTWTLPNGIRKNVSLERVASMLKDGQKLERGPNNYHAYIDGSRRVILQSNNIGGKGVVDGLVIEPSAWAEKNRGVWADGKRVVPDDVLAHKLAHDIIKVMRPDIEKLYQELAPDTPKAFWDTFWDTFWESQMAYLRMEFEKMIARVQVAQPKDPVATYYLEGRRIGGESGGKILLEAGKALVKARHMDQDKLEALKLALRLQQKQREAEEKQAP